MTIESAKIIEKITHANKILIITHVNPDGDALGSAGALSFYFQNQLNKSVDLFCANAIPENLQYLNLEKFVIKENDLDLEKYDLLIACDCADMLRTGIAEKLSLAKNKTTLINIDHHGTNPLYGDINLVKIISSTSEIIFSFLQDCQAKLTPDIANCLMTGVVTDTSYFTNAATTPSSVAMSSTLLNAGANIKSIVNNTWKNQTITSLKVWGQVLSKLHFDEEHKIVTAIITEDEAINSEIFDGLANFLTTIYEANIIVVLRQQGEYVKGSLRTVKDNIDVTKLAKIFGGGGHAKASGFSIKGKLVRLENGWKII